MNPVINVGTEKEPMMVICATTMVMMYEKATGKTFGDDTMDDYVNTVTATVMVIIKELSNDVIFMCNR